MGVVCEVSLAKHSPLLVDKLPLQIFLALLLPLVKEPPELEPIGYHGNNDYKYTFILTSISRIGSFSFGHSLSTKRVSNNRVFL